MRSVHSTLSIAIAFIGAGVLIALMIPPRAPALSAAAHPASADDLAARVTALEAMLGIESGATLAPRAAQSSYESLLARTEAMAEAGTSALARIPSISPVDNPRVTSPYTQRRFHPVLSKVLPHYGLDLAARTGQPVRATADGTVSTVVTSPSYGKTVDIDHGNGFITRYAHASRILVQPGDLIRRGDVIALAGATGLTTGPHVHYEVFKDGWSIDPFTLMNDHNLAVGRSRTAQ